MKFIISFANLFFQYRNELLTTHLYLLYNYFFYNYNLTYIVQSYKMINLIKKKIFITL